jgi:hypothetical protein
MENREFASYGYQADNTMNKLIGAAIVSVFIAIACTGIFRSPWFLVLLLIPVGIFVYIKRSGISKPLLIAGRYLILGDRIVYYRNVSQVRLDKQKQTLTINSDRGRNLVISADKFPTNARKPDKIRINRTAKFDKVSERIIARLQAASPDIVIS